MGFFIGLTTSSQFFFTFQGFLCLASPDFAFLVIVGGDGFGGDSRQLTISLDEVENILAERFGLHHVHEHDKGRPVSLLDVQFGICRQNDGEDAVKYRLHVGFYNGLKLFTLLLLTLFELAPVLPCLLHP